MSSNKRKSLGRGLKALIPVSEKKTATAAVGGIFLCPLNHLVPNEEQPRQSFDEDKLRELTESVRSKGVIQPLVVRALDSGESGRFQIVVGERRWRAARLAGLNRVPVVVKDVSDAEMLEIALIENIQREDLNPIEEAGAYLQLIEEHGLNQDQLAKRVGRKRSTVANTLRLLKLPDEIQKHLMIGEITMGHARAILGLDSSSAQMALARKVVDEGLSVRSCEQMVCNRAKRSERQRKSSRAVKLDPSRRRLVEDLQRRFGTKVDLQQSRRGGKVVIHYYSDRELDRIIQVIQGS